MNKILWLACFLLSSPFLMSQEIVCDDDASHEMFSTPNQEEFSPYCRLEAGYAFGRFIGLKQNYAELGLFSIVKADRRWYFLSDLRGYMLEDEDGAGSFGGGIRCPTRSNAIFGANLYYDFRKDQRVLLQRVGAGLEYLSCCFDFRLNGYFPVYGDTKCSRRHVYNDYIGNYFASSTRINYIFTGFDAEIGSCFYQNCGYWLYGAIGPYYYRHKQIREIYGGQARLELNWKDYLYSRVSVSYDNKFHTNVQGKVMISIPLSDIFYCGCALLEWCQPNLYRPIERNGVIFVDPCCNYTWNW
jgi:hypothetical protein